jgi:hypothetical protein
MDKVRYTSIKFKVWEDRFFKLDLQKKHLHLEEIKIDLHKKNTNIHLDDLKADELRDETTKRS